MRTLQSRFSSSNFQLQALGSDNAVPNNLVRRAVHNGLDVIIERDVGEGQLHDMSRKPTPGTSEMVRIIQTRKVSEQVSKHLPSMFAQAKRRKCFIAHRQIRAVGFITDRFAGNRVGIFTLGREFGSGARKAKRIVFVRIEVIPLVHADAGQVGSQPGPARNMLPVG